MATGAHGCAPWASIFCPPGLCAKYSVCGLPQCGAGNSARGRLSAGWTAGADGLLEKGQFLYRVVLPVSRPERGAAQYSACGNQGIAEFHCVALSVASEVIACLAACFRIDRNACQSTEQVVEGVLFRRARPGPKLGGADRRIQDGNVGAAQLGPSGDQIRVSPARHLNEDIGIDQHTHFAVSLSRRSPRRSLRTISTASGVPAACLRIPTNACMAFIRWPRFPR